MEMSIGILPSALRIALILLASCVLTALGLAGGTEPRPHAYPFVVRLTDYNETVCSGSILTEDVVLVGHHCSNIDAARVTLHAGDVKVSITESSEQLVKEDKEGMRAPRSAHLSLSRYGDILIARVIPPFRFNKYVQPVKLAPPDYRPQPGTEVTLVGWGAYFNPPGTLPFLYLDVLQERNVSFVGGRCRPQGREHSDVLCTSPGKSSCWGDDGGPVLATINGELLQVATMTFYPYVGARDCQDEDGDLPRPVVLLGYWHDWLWCIVRLFSAKIYRLSLSSPLLQTMCMQKEKYEETKEIQPPIKDPAVSGNYSEVYMWNEKERLGVFYRAGSNERCPEPERP